MKVIKYQLCTEVNHGTKDQPNIEQVFSGVSNRWSEANEEIAKAEAYNGEYTIEDDGKPEPVIQPTNAELAAENKLLKEQVIAQSAVASIAFVALAESGKLDEVTASEHAELFAEWAYPIAYTVGQLRRYNGKLYKCVQAHTSQEGWNPSLTPAMWTVVDVTHAGTLDDPIPAARGMEYEYGKHYLDPEDGAVYRCARTGEASGGKVTLQYLPHELVGQYFIAV